MRATKSCWLFRIVMHFKNRHSKNILDIVAHFEMYERRFMVHSTFVPENHKWTKKQSIKAIMNSRIVNIRNKNGFWLLTKSLRNCESNLKKKPQCHQRSRQKRKRTWTGPPMSISPRIVPWSTSSTRTSVPFSRPRPTSAEHSSRNGYRSASSSWWRIETDARFRGKEPSR